MLVRKEKKESVEWDVRYCISGEVVSDTALLSPRLLPASKALLSEFDIFATSARGSYGVDPGPVPLRIVTFPASSRGDLLYGVRKRLALSWSLMFSAFAMLRFTALTVRGGGRSNFDAPNERITVSNKCFRGKSPVLSIDTVVS